MRAFADAAAQTNQGTVNLRPVDDAAFAYHRFTNLTVIDLRGREIARPSEQWRFGVKQIERGNGRGHVEVGLVKSGDGSDVFPVAIEEICLHVVFVNASRNHFFAEIQTRSIFLE